MKHIGDMVNEMLDNLSAFVWRAYDLPIAFLALCVLIAGVGLWLILRIAARRKGQKLSFMATGIILLIVLQFVQTLVADRRSQKMQREFRQLRESTTGARLGGDGQGRSEGLSGILAEGSIAADTPKQKIPHLLRSILPSWSVPYRYRCWRVDPGIDYIQLSYSNPKADVHIAMVDLGTDLYEIVMPREVSKKTSTLVFATREKTLVAVNGEAGVSPALGAQLGEWKGNYIVNGQTVYLDDDDQRPFLSFDRTPTGRYFPSAVVDRTNTPEKYNTIWGRYDLLIDGKLAIDPRDGTADSQYPRTILGLNETGKVLFLMVVDGSNASHSRGLTMEQCGRILQGLGCKNAMACDQGGSSCMCIGKAGIISSPSGGTDRRVYTHFGVRRSGNVAAPTSESESLNQSALEASVPADELSEKE